jgi:hypothetical protein
VAASKSLRSIPPNERESQLQIRGNPKREFARKSVSRPQIPANPIAAIPAISIVDQSLRDISRTTGWERFQPHHANEKEGHMRVSITLEASRPGGANYRLCLWCSAPLVSIVAVLSRLF